MKEDAPATNNYLLRCRDDQRRWKGDSHLIDEPRPEAHVRSRCHIFDFELLDAAAVENKA